MYFLMQKLQRHQESMHNVRCYRISVTGQEEPSTAAGFRLSFSSIRRPPLPPKRQISILSKRMDPNRVNTDIDLEPFSPLTNAHPVDRHSDLPEIPPGSNIRHSTACVYLHKTQPIRCQILIHESIVSSGDRKRSHELLEKGVRTLEPAA